MTTDVQTEAMRILRGPEKVDFTGGAFETAYLTPMVVDWFDEFGPFTTLEERAGYFECLLRDPRPDAKLIADYNRGIYLASATFPQSCCVCMEPPVGYAFVEVGIPTKSLKLTAPSSMRQRISNAICNVRVWYGAPVCHQHRSKSRPFFAAWVGTDKKVVFRFSNEAYGKLFAGANGVHGRCVATSIVGLRNVLRWVGSALFVIGIGIACLAFFGFGIRIGAIGFVLVTIGLAIANSAELIGRPWS